MTNPADDYNDVLLDKIMELRSRPNYADGALRYFAESEMNAGDLEKLLLEKAKVLAMMEIARLLNMITSRPQ